MKRRDVLIVLGASALGLAVGVTLAVGGDPSGPYVVGAGVVLLGVAAWFGLVSPSGERLTWRRDANMRGAWQSVAGFGVLLALMALAAFGDLLETAPLVALALVGSAGVLWVVLRRSDR